MQDAENTGGYCRFENSRFRASFRSLTDDSIFLLA
jgi:hypothetical protein